MALATRTGPLIAAPRELLPATGARRVVIVGGGWGGLSTAARLRQLAPEFEVVLIDRQAIFWSFPQSNKWLVGLAEDATMSYEIVPAARRHGYTFIEGTVTGIDRAARRVLTAEGSLGYDWLVLSLGIRHDYTAWFGNEQAPAEAARRQFPSAFASGDEVRLLRKKLQDFRGGELVMTIPPMPYRCPPAPYERACTIGWWLKSRGIKGRLTVLDPNPAALGYDRVFRQHYREQIVYVPQATLKSVDPFARTLSTDFDTFRFDDAILMPPQQAGELAWQAGLIGRDATGKPSGWAAQDAVSLASLADDRVFLVGDMIDKVSPLFGHYPKSGHLANRLGHIAAAQITARAKGEAAVVQLPDSVCYVHTNVAPMEMLRLDAQYRLRGDGLVTQTIKQHYDPNPRGEDGEWLQAMYHDFLLPSR